MNGNDACREDTQFYVAIVLKLKSDDQPHHNIVRSTDGITSYVGFLSS